VRHRDVTIRKKTWPIYDGRQKWIDLSVVTGVLVLYEGRKPVYTTLVSVGRPPGDLGDGLDSAGHVRVVASITSPKLDPKTVAGTLPLRLVAIELTPD
jgi:hypothetical protein